MVTDGGFLEDETGQQEAGWRRSLSRFGIARKRHPESLDAEQHLDRRIGLFNKSGTQLLESPPPGVLANVAKNNPDGRVEYFRFRTVAPVTKQRIEDSGELVTWEGLEPEGVDHSPSVTIPIEDGYSAGYGMGDGSIVFANLAVVPELEKEIAKTFSDRELVGTRGIAVALGDGVTVGGERINTIQEILQAGGERSTDSPAQTAFSLNDGGKINNRSVQWLIEHPQNLRRYAVKEGNTEAASKIFPALLVYDRSKFAQDSVRLPESSDERSRIILKAYILDYPMP